MKAHEGMKMEGCRRLGCGERACKFLTKNSKVSVSRKTFILSRERMRRKFERYSECHAVGNAGGNVLRSKLMCARHEFCRFSKRDAPNITDREYFKEY